MENDVLRVAIFKGPGLQQVPQKGRAAEPSGIFIIHNFKERWAI